MGVKSLPKTVFRQRRCCDLNPGPSVHESSTLTTRLLSHPRIEANSHHQTRHDNTVLSVSRPLRRCELNSRQLNTVADRNLKSEHVQSNRPIYTRAPDTTQDRTVLWCLAGGVSWALGP